VRSRLDRDRLAFLTGRRTIGVERELGGFWRLQHARKYPAAYGDFAGSFAGICLRTPNNMTNKTNRYPQYFRFNV